MQSARHYLVSRPVADDLQSPFFLLIDKALRDEGTSSHYVPIGRYSVAHTGLVKAVSDCLGQAALPVNSGSSWTTDAPFRETGKMILDRREKGVVAMEMEAAALIALGTALKKPGVCLAHITEFDGHLGG